MEWRLPQCTIGIRTQESRAGKQESRAGKQEHRALNLNQKCPKLACSSASTGLMQRTRSQARSRGRTQRPWSWGRLLQSAHIRRGVGWCTGAALTEIQGPWSLHALTSFCLSLCKLTSFCLSHCALTSFCLSQCKLTHLRELCETGPLMQLMHCLHESV